MKVFTQMYISLVKKILFTILAEKVGVVGHFSSFVRHYYYMDRWILFSFSYIVVE